MSPNGAAWNSIRSNCDSTLPRVRIGAKDAGCPPDSADDADFSCQSARIGGVGRQNGAIFLHAVAQAVHNLLSEQSSTAFLISRKGPPMGSSALRDAIQGIIDWGETVGRVGGDLPKATDAFGSLTFNDEVQQARLPKPVYAALRRTIVEGEPLDPSVADAVGDGDEGLGGRARRDALHALVPAADRHHRREARLASSRRRADGKAVAEFSGKELIKGEPDASSFPSGGMRSHLRGARLHGVGSDQPALAARQRPNADDAGHPDGVRELDGRGARQEDAAAALDGSAVDAGGAHPEAVRIDRPGASSRRAAPSRSTS